MEKIEELETEGKEWTLSVDFSNLTAQSQEARETLLQPIFYVKKQKVNVRVTSDGTSAIGEQFQNLFVETDNSQTILRTVLIPPPSIPPQAGGSRQETSPLQFPPPFTGGERGVMRQLSELLIKSLE
ncbi:MAG: hypothetical protein RBT80_07530 [Candidatus Vecturithrix sp.]|nr:hypothetical protein [Candidatus Vecturithrix sp.]